VFGTSANTIGQVSIILGAGVGLWRIAVVNKDSIRAVARCVYFCLSPALILTAGTTSFTLEKLAKWWILPAACVVHMIIAGVLGWGMARVTQLAPSERRMAILACTFHNLGGLPFVFVAALSRCWTRIADDPNALADGFGMIFTYGIPWQCLIYSIGLMVIRANNEESAVVETVDSTVKAMRLQEDDKEDDMEAAIVPMEQLISGESSLVMEDPSEEEPLREKSQGEASCLRDILGLCRVACTTWLGCPSTIALATAIFIGCTQPLRDLFFGAAAPLGFIAGGLTSLGEACVPLNTMILAAGLARSARIPQVPLDGGAKEASPSLEKGHSLRLSTRCMLVIIVTKLVLAPLVGIAGTAALAATGMLGDIYQLGPLFLFLLLVEPAMPSAQNLVVLFQVEGQSDAATRLSSVYVFQYAAAAITMTIWVMIVIGIVEVVIPA